MKPAWIVLAHLLCLIPASVRASMDAATCTTSSGKEVQFQASKDLLAQMNWTSARDGFGKLPDKAGFCDLREFMDRFSKVRKPLSKGDAIRKDPVYKAFQGKTAADKALAAKYEAWLTLDELIDVKVTVVVDAGKKSV